MARVLAFDVYGTLIDTAGVVAALRLIVGDKAGDFSRLWRDKQLEYSFRRGLMRCYEDFSVCVRDALAFSAASFGLALSASDRDSLLAAYRQLPPFADAVAALAALDDGRFRLYAFSNGAAATVTALLEGAGIRQHFSAIVSVEACRSFKPDPAVYRYFLDRADVAGSEAWLVSGNPFDVIGAMSAGMRGLWVRRGPEAVFDPWGIEPSLTVASLTEIGDRLAYT